MKITFDEIVPRRDEWIHKELLRSLHGDIIHKAKDDRFFEVKLLVNGVELEPSYFNDIMNNLEKYIDSEAKVLAKEYFEELRIKSQKLSDMIDEATRKIANEFSLDTE